MCLADKIEIETHTYAEYINISATAIPIIAERAALVLIFFFILLSQITTHKVKASENQMTCFSFAYDSSLFVLCSVSW